MGLDFGGMLMKRDADADAKARQDAAQKETSKRGIFGSIGGLLGTFLPVLLAPVTGGLSLAAGAIASGVGAAAGQAIGRNLADKSIPDIKTKFGQSDTQDMYESLQRQDDGAIIKAGMSAAVQGYFNPMTSTLSDTAKIDHFTKGLDVGSDAYFDALKDVDFRNPTDAMQYIQGGMSDAGDDLVEGGMDNFVDFFNVDTMAPAGDVNMMPDDFGNITSRTRVEPEPFTTTDFTPISKSDVHSNIIDTQGAGGDSPLFGPGYTGAHDVTGVSNDNKIFTPRDLFVSDDAWDDHLYSNQPDDPQTGLLGLYQTPDPDLTTYGGINFNVQPGQKYD